MSKGRTLETKILQIQRKELDAEKGIIKGYAAVFGNVDSYGDVIEKGAFEKFLKGGFDRVKILAQHNDGINPIGKPILFKEDDFGLYMEAQISNTTEGDNILTLLRDGVLDELSIGYLALDYKYKGDNRHLTEIELQEVSVVTWAANEEAKILSVKSRSLLKGLPAETKAELINFAKHIDKISEALKSLTTQDDSVTPPALAKESNVIAGITKRRQRKQRVISLSITAKTKGTRKT